MSLDAHCCIVGGGPAGMILALLLGRAGIPTTLLEEHEDFERDFRGDTVHSSTMELMDQLGLADDVLKLAHARISRLSFDTPNGPLGMADLSRLKTKFPFIAMMPQARFLDFLAKELAKQPSVRLILGASAQGLLWEDASGRTGIADRAPETAASPAAAAHPAAQGHGALPADAKVTGVHYRTKAGQFDVRAPLTIAADGRFSRLRRLSGFELQSSSPPMDVIWFRVPRRPDEPVDARGKIGKGHLLVVLNRGEEWQIAYVIAKGTYKQIHDTGLPAFHQAIADMAPEFADRVKQITDWHQVSLLAVEAGRVKKWFRPGLLLIGDAAHVMSPVGGVGINYAIQDAVVTANVLTKPLRSGRLHLRDLAAVQRQREIPVRIIQGFQRIAQEQIITRALASDAPMKPPPILQLPILRDIIPRMVALGVWPVHWKS